MMDNTKIGTLNLCLGLRSKKDEVKRLIKENKIDILCVQESEITKGYPIELLSFEGYNYENESNDVKSRCGIYIANSISYVRRNDLEVKNLHVVIIDLKNEKQHIIIILYRTFNPQSTLSQKQFFEAQLHNIEPIITNNTIILGDFNLDEHKRFEINYSHKHYFEALNNHFDRHNLIQIIDFDTWSRVVNNIPKTSIIDHVYLKDPTSVNNVSALTLPFGDHKLMMLKRNWKLYSKEKLLAEISAVDWQIKKDSVQSFWNEFEGKLVKIVDKLAPLQTVTQIEREKSKPPAHIKNKINKRNRLCKKSNINNAVKNAIKTLKKEIKFYFHNQKTQNVRRGILPGNSKSLWDAEGLPKTKIDPVYLITCPSTIKQYKMRNFRLSLQNFS